MKKIKLFLVLLTGIVAVGCTSPQTATQENHNLSNEEIAEKAIQNLKLTTNNLEVTSKTDLLLELPTEKMEESQSITYKIDNVGNILVENSNENEPLLLMKKTDSGYESYVVNNNKLDVSTREVINYDMNDLVINNKILQLMAEKNYNLSNDQLILTGKINFKDLITINENLTVSIKEVMENINTDFNLDVNLSIDTKNYEITNIDIDFKNVLVKVFEAIEDTLPENEKTIFKTFVSKSLEDSHMKMTLTRTFKNIDTFKFEE